MFEILADSETWKLLSHRIQYKKQGHLLPKINKLFYTKNQLNVKNVNDEYLKLKYKKQHILKICTWL